MGTAGRAGDGPDHKLTLAKPGKLKPEEYDAAVGDLVAFMIWMGEPMAQFRKQLGVVVLIFLAVLSSSRMP